MSSPIDTEDWRLSAFIEWKPKKEPYRIQCPSCHGSGKVGGGFKDIDGPRDCHQCYGSGFIMHPGPSTPKPELPQDLLEHMRKAWKSYFEAESGISSDSLPTK